MPFLLFHNVKWYLFKDHNIKTVCLNILDTKTKDSLKTDKSKKKKNGDADRKK